VLRTALILSVITYGCLISLLCGPKTILDRHVFYAGSIKDGQEILKMNDWRMTEIDSTTSGREKVYIFHYKEMELK